MQIGSKIEILCILEQDIPNCSTYFRAGGFIISTTTDFYYCSWKSLYQFEPVSSVGIFGLGIFFYTPLILVRAACWFTTQHGFLGSRWAVNYLLNSQGFAEKECYIKTSLLVLLRCKLAITSWWTKFLQSPAGLQSYPIWLEKWARKGAK